MTIQERFMRVAMNLMGLFSLATVGLTLSTAMAGDAWYPVAIDVWSPPFNAEHQHAVQQYVPPERASRPWRICASIPHLKDDYWLSVNFGLVDEAKRLGIALNLYEAGGYENLATQQSQIAECMAKHNAQALIIGAISADGLNSVIADYSDKGLPVIDLINGINSDKIAARVAADFYDMGLAAGKYLTTLQQDTSKAAKVAWFPGPAGAGWVATGDKGFRAALNGSALSIGRRGIISSSCWRMTTELHSTSYWTNASASKASFRTPISIPWKEQCAISTSLLRLTALPISHSATSFLSLE
jgi:periplasmic protein TorT